MRYRDRVALLILNPLNRCSATTCAVEANRVATSQTRSIFIGLTTSTTLLTRCLAGQLAPSLLRPAPASVAGAGVLARLFLMARKCPKLALPRDVLLTRTTRKVSLIIFEVHAAC